MKTWVAICYCRAVKTILVRANTRKEAQAKLDANPSKGEGVDVSYYAVGKPKVLREDKPIKRL